MIASVMVSPLTEATRRAASHRSSGTRTARCGVFGWLGTLLEEQMGRDVLPAIFRVRPVRGLGAASRAGTVLADTGIRPVVMHTGTELARERLKRTLVSATSTVIAVVQVGFHSPQSTGCLYTCQGRALRLMEGVSSSKAGKNNL
jgi:hypothetical protein